MGCSLHTHTLSLTHTHTHTHTKLTVVFLAGLFCVCHHHNKIIYPTPHRLTYKRSIVYPTGSYPAWLTAEFNGQNVLEFSAPTGVPSNAATGSTPIVIQVTAVNSYGFNVTIPVYLPVVVLDTPDSTTTVICQPSQSLTNTTSLSFAGFESGAFFISTTATLQCVITAKNNNITLLNTISDNFYPRATLGTIAFSALTQNKGILGTFTLIYTPPDAGGRDVLTVEVMSVAKSPFIVYTQSAPDSTSTLICTPATLTLASANSTDLLPTTCKLQSQKNSVSAFSFWPFLVTASPTLTVNVSACPFAQPCVVPSFVATSQVVFSSVSPAYGVAFYFNVSLPPVVGTYQLVVASSIVTSVLIISDLPDTGSYIRCGSQYVQADGSIGFNVFNSTTTVTFGPNFVCLAYASFNNSLLVDFPIQFLALIIEPPGYLKVTGSSDTLASRFFLNPVSSYVAPMNFSIRLQLAFGNFVPTSSIINVTAFPVMDNTTIVTCPAVSLCSKLISCMIVPRRANVNILALPTSLGLSLQSVSSQSVLITDPYTLPVLNATLWTGLYSTGITYQPSSAFTIFIFTSTISERLALVFTDTSYGFSVTNVAISFLSTPDNSSSVFVPNTVPSNQTVPCTISARNQGSAIFTDPRYFSIAISADPTLGSCLLGFGTQVSQLVSQSNQLFLVSLASPVSNGPVYVSLCFSSTGLGNWQLASTAVVLIVSNPPNATLSCRRPVVASSSSITCYVFGFTINAQNVRQPLYVDRNILSLAAKIVYSSSASVTNSLTVSAIDTVAVPTQFCASGKCAWPRVEVTVQASIPFTQFSLTDGKSVVPSMTSNPSGQTVSWVPLGQGTVTTVSPAVFYLLSRATTFVTFFAQAAQAQFSAVTTPFPIGAGTTTGAERFVQYSCSNTVCMAVSDSGFLFSWGLNVNQNLGRVSSTSYDSLAQTTIDRYGWQHLLPPGNNFYDTPAFQQVAVNPVDDSTAVLTDDGQVLLIGTPLSTAGTMYAVSIEVFGAVILNNDLTANVVKIATQSVYWTAVTSSGYLYAFRVSNGILLSEQLNPGVTTKVSAVFFSATTSQANRASCIVCIFGYDDGSIYVTGTGMNMAALMGENYKQTVLQKMTANQLSLWGLPAVSISKFDGYYDSVNSEGKIYALTKDGRIYIMAISNSVAFPVFQGIELV